MPYCANLSQVFHSIEKHPGKAFQSFILENNIVHKTTRGGHLVQSDQKDAVTWKPKEAASTGYEKYYRPMDLYFSADTNAIKQFLAPLFNSVNAELPETEISIIRQLIGSVVDFDIDSMDVQVNEVGSSRATGGLWVQLRYFREPAADMLGATLIFTIHFQRT